MSESLNELTDADAVAFAKQLSIELAESTDHENMAAAMAAFPAEVGDELAGFVTTNLTEAGESAISSAASIATARALLAGIDAHPVLGPIARDRAATFSNRDMADPILSLGVVASLVFLSLTSYVHVSYDKVNGLRIAFGKKPLEDAEIVKSVMGPMSRASAEARSAQPD